VSCGDRSKKKKKNAEDVLINKVNPLSAKLLSEKSVSRLLKF